MLSHTRFLQPNLGMPCVISKKKPDLSVIVVVPKAQSETDILEQAFFLTSVNHPDLRWPLKTLDVEELDEGSFGSPVREILKVEKPRFLKISLGLTDQDFDAQDFPYRYLLFNLNHPAVSVGYHSVVFIFHDWETYVFGFITDTHVADVWDRIQKDFSRLASTDAKIEKTNLFCCSRAFSRRAFSESFINPNRNLVHFIRTANTLALRKELDFIILAGDLVDYKFKKNLEETISDFPDTNFKLLENILTGKYAHGVELKVPLFTTTGNHDYRLYPYKISHYGLERCGLHSVQKDYLLQIIDGSPKKSFSLKDLRSLAGKKGKNHSLNFYFLHFNPSSDFSFKIRRTKFIFVDTGRDAFLNLAHIHVRRYANLIKSVRFSWDFPDSEGLSDRQTQFIDKEVSGDDQKNIIFIFHSGIFNTHFHHGSLKEDFNSTINNLHMMAVSSEYKFPLQLSDYMESSGNMRDNIRFEKALKSSRLNYGGLFQNQLPIVKMACQSQFHFLGLSGHHHRNFEVKIDKNKKEIFNKDYTQPHLIDPFEKDVSYFLNCCALGHTQSGYDQSNFPGYYLVKLKNDKVIHIKRKSLNAPPLENFSFFARKRRHSPRSTEVEIQTEMPTHSSNEIGNNLKLLVTFAVISKKKNFKFEDFPVEIKPRMKNCVVCEQRKWIESWEKDEFFAHKPVLFFHSFLCEYHPSLIFNLEKREARRRFDILVIGEYVLENKEVLKPLKLYWHPKSITLS
jgi:hypothetical protein